MNKVLSVCRIKLRMSNPLLEVKAVFDEVLAIIDVREQGPDRALRLAALKLLTVEEHKDNLPGELKPKLSRLLTCLRQNAWIQHPDIGVAEIKRFHTALLRAMQSPDMQTIH